MPKSSLVLALCCVLALATTQARADWADFSRYGEEAEMAVEPEEIRLNLRLAEKALPAGLVLPTQLPTSPPPWLAERLPQLLDNHGQALAGRLLFLNKTEASADKESFYETGISFASEKSPTELALKPPAAAQAPVGLVVLHRGVPVSDLAQLNKILKLTLDWADPWRSRFDDPTLVRRHAEPRSYLYAEPYEVRHELLLRLNDLKPWLTLGLRDPRYIDDDEREAVKHQIGAFLAGRNPVQIDGTPAAPQLDRVQFLRFNRAGVVPVTEAGRLDAETVLVGVVLAYLTEAPARTIALNWDLFSADSVPRQLSLIRGKETFDGYMSLKQPEFAWSQEESLESAPLAEEPPKPAPPQATQLDAPLAPPALLLAALIAAFAYALFAPSSLLKTRPASAAIGLLLILAAGFVFYPRHGALADGSEAHAEGLDEPQAKALLQALLHNAYRAFPLRDEEKAYDRLAKSLDGDLLDDIYLQQRSALLRLSSGLAGEGQVDRIDLLESRPHRVATRPGDWEVDTRWMAHGSVSHWGHSHERHNLYQARLTLRPAKDGQWKIVGMEFIGGQRLDAGASS
jgi:hypothetical protein